MSTCLDHLPPAAKQCAAAHCADLHRVPEFHAICNCLDWQGKPIPDCSPRDTNYPVQTGQCLDTAANYQPLGDDDCFKAGWKWEICYCCCNGCCAQTPVATPSGHQAIDGIRVGDQVLAAARSDSGWSWQAHAVGFSAAAPRAGSGQHAVLIDYGAGKSLHAAPNQLFLLAPSGKLKRADQLLPGLDQLVGEDGASLPIERVSDSPSGIYLLATAVVSYEAFDGAIDHHLISLNGVIAGDYLLQLYQDTDKLRPHLAPAAPASGASLPSAETSTTPTETQ